MLSRAIHSRVGPRPYSRPRPYALDETPPRTWNPLRRFCPLLPAWWAHIKNQRILNDYITGIIRARWDVILKERSLAAAATSAGASSVSGANGVGGSGDGKASSPAAGRKRDILDKVLDSLEPGEWGAAAVLQVSSVCQVPAKKYRSHRCQRLFFVGNAFRWLWTVSVHDQIRSSETCRLCRYSGGGVRDTLSPAKNPCDIRSTRISISLFVSACSHKAELVG